MTIFFGKTAVHLSFLLDFKNIILNVVSIEKIIKIARFLTTKKSRVINPFYLHCQFYNSYGKYICKLLSRLIK